MVVTLTKAQHSTIVNARWYRGDAGLLYTLDNFANRKLATEKSICSIAHYLDMHEYAEAEGVERRVPDELLSAQQAGSGLVIAISQRFTEKT